MPLYEYECKQCRQRTEKIQKFSDPEITTCPHCGGPLERVISAPAISFKGGGWFADGYGNHKPSSGPSEGKSEGKTEGKSDSGKSSSASGESGGSKSDSVSTPSSSTPASAPTAPAPSSSSSEKK